MTQKSVKVKNDHRSKFFQFKQLERRSLKKNQGFKLEKFTAIIILHFHLQPQFKNELFHVYFTSFHSSREI